MNDIEEAIKRQIGKATENPLRTINAVVYDVKENFDLRKASAANDRTHGYTAKHGDAGYVEYKDRNDDWRAVDNMIQSRWESRGDEVDENMWRLALLMHSLSYMKLRRIADIIKGDE